MNEPLCAMYFDIELTRPISIDESKQINVYSYSLIDDNDIEHVFRFDKTLIEHDRVHPEIVHVETVGLSVDSDLAPTLDILKEMSFGEFSIGIPARVTFDVEYISNLIFEFKNSDMLFHASMSQLFDINKHL